MMMPFLPLDEGTSTSVAISVVCVAVSIVLIAASVKRKRNNDCNTRSTHHPRPPMAQGAVWILGHALQYKSNPPGFLKQQEESVGKVFCINLAGRKMVVIGSDSTAMKQVATKTESQASSRQAVAELGFEYTLGPVNMYRGTDFHKRILRDSVLSQKLFDSQFLPRLYDCLHDALQKETLPKAVSVVSYKDGIVKIHDLFQLVRRCILRASLDCFVSPLLLQMEGSQDLLNALMMFQDSVEDATAKAAVLSPVVAVPFILKPAARIRKWLVLQVAAKLERIQEENENMYGPWLKAFRDCQIPAREAAELVLGLMFAAHKNPAIGAAQSFCFLQTSASQPQQERARKEAARLHHQLQSKTSPEKALLQAKTLRACVLETMRLTAHSIGAIRLVQEPFDLETESGKIYHICKGDTLAISHITSHYNQNVWGTNASHYRLDRPEWNKDASSMACPVDAYKLTTFSHGIHKCPGERVAMAMMEIMLALLLVHNTKLVEEQIANISFERATLAQREGPVPVSINTQNRNDTGQG